MQEIDTNALLYAATNLARVNQILGAHGDAPLTPEDMGFLSVSVGKFRVQAEKLGARLAMLSADRFIARLSSLGDVISRSEAATVVSDIESRFADYLIDVKMFALSSEEAVFLGPADDLIDSKDFSLTFPSAAFEVEEAAKCIALGRHTAGVFHAMRVMEIGIRALAKRLGIPDPTRPAEKNWALVLRTISEKIDELWPPKSRLPYSEGAAFEGLYATLDAIRNPWRNATMHVETIYAPHESLHIIRCCAFFMKKLQLLSDENGEPPVAPELPISPSA